MSQKKDNGWEYWEKAHTDPGSMEAQHWEAVSGVNPATGKRKGSGGGGGGCFPASAIVITENGPKRIAEVSPGETVLTWDADADKFLSTEAVCTLRHRRAYLLRISLSDGKTLYATGNHSLRSQQGWTRADKLSLGDEILDRNGEWLSIAELGFTSESEPVFNLITYGTNTLVVDGIVSHNFTHAKTLQAAFFNQLWRLRRMLSRPFRASPGLAH